MQGPIITVPHTARMRSDLLEQRVWIEFGLFFGKSHQGCLCSSSCDIAEVLRRCCFIVLLEPGAST